MIISAFSDGEKEDKIAEFYDTTYPCSFMKGLLAESQEQEKDIQITFSVRHRKKMHDFYSEDFIKKANTAIFNEEETQLINEEYDKCEKFYGEDL